jgi:hypothetical protein
MLPAQMIFRPWRNARRSPWVHPETDDRIIRATAFNTTAEVPATIVRTPMKPFSIPEETRNEHVVLAKWSSMMSGCGIAFRIEEHGTNRRG